MSEAKKKKITIRSIIKSNKFLMVFAVLCSMVIWITITLTVSEDITITVEGVDIDYNLENTVFGQRGYEIFGEPRLTVDVSITGKRYIVGNVTKNDILVKIATIPGREADGPGNTTLSLVATKANDKQFEIIAPSVMVNVFLDERVERTFELTPKVTGISEITPEFYISETPTLNPSDITISGPKTQIYQIDQVLAQCEITEPLTKTYNSVAEIILDGKYYLDFKYCEYDQEIQYEMTIPVLKRKDIKPTIEFVNQPSYYETDPLAVEMTPQELKLKGSEEAIDAMTEYVIGTIDFMEINPENDTFKFPLNLPSGIKTIEELDEISVTFDLSDYGSRILTLPQENIVVKNVPLDKQVEVVSQSIQNVEVVCPKNIVSLLTEEDVVAEIDYSTIESPGLGEQGVKASFYVKEKNNCWIYGSYEVMIRISDRSAATTTSP